MCGKTTQLFLSIVIPVRNRPTEIIRSVRSVAQQLAGLSSEIIVVDDASTDETSAVLDCLAEEYPCIRIVRLPLHKGAAAARNAGLDVARGRYVWFVDSDDIVISGAIGLIWPELQGGELDVLRFDKQAGPRSMAVDAKVPDEIPAVSRFDLREDINGLLACLSMGSIWNAVFSRQAIGGTRFEESFPYGEDALFTWAVALHAKRCVYIHAPLYLYSETPGSLTSSKTTERFRCYMRQVECFLPLIACSGLGTGHKEVLYSECEWRVYAHAFGCYRPREINSEMWRTWRNTYNEIMVLNVRRSRPRRLLSSLVRRFATKHVAYSIFLLLLWIRRHKKRRESA